MGDALRIRKPPPPKKVDTTDSSDVSEAAQKLTESTPGLSMSQ